MAGFVNACPSNVWTAHSEMSNGRSVSMLASKNLNLETFVSKTMPLIDLEKEAEIAASKDTISKLNTLVVQKRGYGLFNLKCSDVQTGLMGRTIFELQPNHGNLLPPHKLIPHDVVVLKLNKADSSSPILGQGVVYRLKDTSILIALDDVPEEGLNFPLRLEKVANEVTYQRLKETLIELRDGIERHPAAELAVVLFGDKGPTYNKSETPLNFHNKNLDHSQVAAVLKALASKDVMLLHGPPGTGKTTTVVEIILQEVQRGSKILVCAASNIAVDNIVERLACHSIKLVRLGHPARLLPQILDCALDAQVLKGDGKAIANDIRKELQVLSRRLMKANDKKSRGDLRKQIRRLAREQRQREQQAASTVIHNSSVVLTTLTGALSRELRDVAFDIVIIDEAAQAMEVACWTAILKGRRCILAGDHLQLPPTILSVEAEKQGLGRTLFERLSAMYGSQVTSMLTVQYRMHRHIMDWSSHELYDGKLKAYENVANHILGELEGVDDSALTRQSLILIDTYGCDMEEMQDEMQSFLNEGEAHVAISHAKKLVDRGVKSQDIGIIAPYAAQVQLLKQLKSEENLLSGLEISTVDGFQGREKEAIIISMVRSNALREVGFLCDHRRMNVAITRARRQCCIICDTATVSRLGFLKRLVDYFEKNGEYLNAMYI